MPFTLFSRLFMFSHPVPSLRRKTCLLGVYPMPAAWPLPLSFSLPSLFLIKSHCQDQLLSAPLFPTLSSPFCFRIRKFLYDSADLYLYSRRAVFYLITSKGDFRLSPCPRPPPMCLLGSKRVYPVETPPVLSFFAL